MPTHYTHTHTVIHRHSTTQHTHAQTHTHTRINTLSFIQLTLARKRATAEWERTSVRERVSCGWAWFAESILCSYCTVRLEFRSLTCSVAWSISLALLTASAAWFVCVQFSCYRCCCCCVCCCRGFCRYSALHTLRAVFYIFFTVRFFYIVTAVAAAPLCMFLFLCSLLVQLLFA